MAPSRNRDSAGMQDGNQSSGRSRRGFGSMDKDELRRVSAKGGRAGHGHRER